jgi:hypothetical protein
MNVQFGKVDTTWEKYGLVQAPILYNGKPSGYKAIIKNKNLVAILGMEYKLIPNEEVVKAGDQVAEEVGAKPFKVRYARTNYILNKTETRVYAQYILSRGFDIEGRDRVYIGFSLMNGIDGSLAFSASGFTFRSICQNGVFVGYREIAHFYRKHTKGLEINLDSVKFAVEKVIDETKDAVNAYRKLTRLEMNEEIAERIAKSSLPRKVLPDYIKVEGETLKSFDPSKSVWDAYNHITEKIWHDVKMDIDRKRQLFNEVHKIIPVIRM